MKNKSIGGFVTGLVGILLGLPIGFYSFIILTLILGLGGFESLVNSVYLFFIAGILAITAVCFYFNKAKVGGILMLIATIFYIAPFIFGVYAVLSVSDSITELLFALIIGNIPTILLLVSAILGLCAKAKAKISPETTNQTIEQ